MTERTPGLSGDDFRRYGKELVDWVADYWDEVEDLPVQPGVQPGAIRALLPDEPPETPEEFDRLIADLDEIVKPGLTHWQSPGWFAYFPGNASFPAILGELVAAGVSQVGMLWSTSPAATEIETQMVDWLVDLLALPQGWKTTAQGGGVIQGTASEATHTALVVARDRAARSHSLDDLVAYGSEQSHSSVEKGAAVAGFRHYRMVAVDAAFAMRPESLAERIAHDKAAGLVPAFVCSTVGTTGTTAVDPVRAISEIARREQIWHHVDAAFAGSAMICPEFRHHQDGLELVDSYVFNPHKWLMVNFDCSIFYVANRAPLLETMSIQPPYLRNEASQSGAVIDYRDWHVPMGRRFRALKLWWVLRSFGAEALRTFIRLHISLGQSLAQRIDEDPRLELVAPTPFSLVSVRHVGGNVVTETLASAINSSGTAYLTTSKLGEVSFIRISIGQTNTTQVHVERLWKLIDDLAPR